MANYICPCCSKPFKRRGSIPAKYCSRPCFHKSRPPSQFDIREWYRKNRAAQNDRRKAWAAANPAKRQASGRKWRMANREKVAASARARTAQKKSVSTAEIISILEAANGHCVYCGGQFDRLELDHVDAMSLGGDFTKSNILPACRYCNASKSNKDVAEWLFKKHGALGCARAIYMLEHRRFEPRLYAEAHYPGVKIVEVRA